jgi:hypothetical protein
MPGCVVTTIFEFDRKMEAAVIRIGEFVSGHNRILTELVARPSLSVTALGTCGRSDKQVGQRRTSFAPVGPGRTFTVPQIIVNYAGLSSDSKRTLMSVGAV